MIGVAPLLVALAGLASSASAHIAFWHNSMYGFNVTDKTFSYDNRPQVPLYSMTFDEWWLHGHIDYPPNDGDFFELPANGVVNSELSCDKGATSWYASSQGGDVGYGSNWPCPGAQSTAFHTVNEADAKGCALAIAYKSDVHDLKPDDFVVFSVNHTCVWYLNTAFQIPDLPACPDGGCHCTFNWIHSIDSGSEQIYQNAFKCKVTGTPGSKALGTPAVPRRCGTDPSESDASVAHPENCTVGAKTPMYWYNKEGNNMPEDTYHAPYYNGLYGFNDGRQTDIFENGVVASLASFSTSAAASTSTSVAVTTTQAAETTTYKASFQSSSKAADPATTDPATTSTIQQTTTHVDVTTSTSEEASSSSSAASTSSTKACKRRSSSSKKRDLHKLHARHLNSH